MISREFTYAVVGATNNRDKYGNTVFNDLRNAGYSVIPVHIKDTEVDGVKAYPNLSSIPEKVDVVITVVPPQATEKVVIEAHSLGITKVWMQPGSESDAAIAYCEANGIECVHNACIMVQRRQNP
jgi:predicted CoA-binding protein